MNQALPEAPAAAPLCAVAGRPTCSPRERAVDNAVHVVGALASVAAAASLITLSAATQDGPTTAILALYALAMTTVFLVSAAYHLVEAPGARRVLRRLDHAAIFVKIAGTYTPFSVFVIGGAWGSWLLVAVWSIAAIGAPLQLFAPKRLERAALVLYLAQGWVMLIAIGPLMAAATPLGFALILAGGLAYTVGVGFFVADRLPFNVALWHVCVLIGSGLMYGAVMSDIALLGAAPPASVIEAATPRGV